MNEWLSTTPIAHRGLHDEQFPENSLAAFEAAAELGYGIELDVQLTAEGTPVVFHDLNSGRMTGKDLVISESPLSQLAALRLHNTAYGMPLLADVLDVIKGRVPLLIELIPGAPDVHLCVPVLDLVAEYEGQVAFQSFDHAILLWLKKHHPNISYGLLAGSVPPEKVLPFYQRTVMLRRGMLMNCLTRPSFISYDLNQLPSKIVDAWRRLLNAPLLTWTIRTESELERAQALGANIIFEGIRP